MELFEPLIVLGGISLLISSISVFLFAFTSFRKLDIDIINGGKHIIYKGEVYEKKD